MSKGGGSAQALPRPSFLIANIMDPGKILGDSPLDKVQLKALLPLVSTGSTIGIPVTGFIAC